MFLVCYRMGSSSLPSGFLVFQGRREFAVWLAFLCLVSKCLGIPANVCVVGPVITRGSRAPMATMRPVPWPLSLGDLHLLELILQVWHHFFHGPQLFCCLWLSMLVPVQRWCCWNVRTPNRQNRPSRPMRWIGTLEQLFARPMMVVVPSIGFTGRFLRMLRAQLTLHES